ncbi:hypothetical protein [Mucilaginibacter terrae]|uniref:Uncharacterized protein n=1 Tax=Mucilaginibacter terrae TaxID=1955052 RepID=A0ABU3GRG6_9SPHI|nr:hypothetical protein [Mucilaginibacter terrae]MDT3402235.1 hypothetical protein [Mucilaginibacter terrae]
MSSAFVREGDSEQLSDVAPNLTALELYLRREYGGTVIKPLKNYQSDKYAREAYDMSDGLTYALNDENKWVILL